MSHLAADASARGEDSSFEANDYQLLKSTTETRIVDDWLSVGSTYYYRVRAVDVDGNKGRPSEICRGVTRELE